MSVPQASGRRGLRACPLRNLPKHSALGRTLRSGLIAPTGTTLAAAEQSGYEVRLLADLSNEKNLLSMPLGTDVHAAIGQHLFGSTRTPTERRQLEKPGTLAVIYGQSRFGGVQHATTLAHGCQQFGSGAGSVEAAGKALHRGVTCRRHT